MKTHWISEISYARTTRKRHHITGPWYTYAKRQANKQVRRNAQLDINEGLDEVCFGPEDDNTHAAFERGEQAMLMNNYQHVLRTALNFVFRCETSVDKYYGYYNDCSWYNADGVCIAYNGWVGIEVIEQHHDFVWNAFKLFL